MTNTPETLMDENTTGPFVITTAASRAPDYAAIRHYASVCRTVAASLYFQRQPFLYSDDQAKTAALLQDHFLHADALREGKRSPLENALIAVSMSPTEVVTGKLDSRKQRPQVIDTIVHVRTGPQYDAWRNEFWRSHGLEMQPQPMDVLPIVESEFASRMMKSLEADPSKTLFIAAVREQDLNDKSRDDLVYSWLRQKWYCQDNSDAVMRIPKVVWLLPLNQYGLMQQSRTRTNALLFDAPFQFIIQHRPYNEWLSVVQERRRREPTLPNLDKESVTTTDMELEIAGHLEGMRNTVRHVQQEKSMTDEQTRTHFQLTEAEAAYLAAFQSTPDPHNPKRARETRGTR
ncbi:hypothetical protein HY642_02750 [Candidatus Woesearchaeota archaeon]|nr:hypothetical protein [Candidatus Woesearchaeota archaeon]